MFWVCWFMLGIVNLFYDFTEQSYNKERVFRQTFTWELYSFANCELFFVLLSRGNPLAFNLYSFIIIQLFALAFLLRYLTKNSDVREFKKITYIMIRMIFPLKYFSIFYPREGLVAVILVFVLHLSISLFSLSIFI